MNIDSICNRFVTEYRKGNRRSVEEFLSEYSESEFPELRSRLEQIERAFAVFNDLRSADDHRIDELHNEQSRGDGPTDGSVTDAQSETVTALANQSMEVGELVESKIGNYDILEEIARGGMGIVYRARQAKLNRVVALKVIKSGTFASDDEVKRFLKEAEAAARLKHPNIVAVYDVGEFDSGYYLSMALVEGGTLQDRLLREPLSNQGAAEMLKEVCEAIHFAHKQKVVHRDLKPHNILLDRSSTPMVTDFGLAKILGQDSDLTHTGQVLGTPSYMSPEQAKGDVSDIGRRTDVYALGGILYCALTGRPPFQSASIPETLRQVIDTEPVPPRKLNPSVDSDLNTICLKCLEKSKSRRYSSAREIANELERYLNGVPIQARPVGATSKLWRWSMRNPTAAAAGCIALALMINLLVLGPIYLWRLSALSKSESASRKAAEVALQESREALAFAEMQQTIAEKERSIAGQQREQFDTIDEAIRDNNERVIAVKEYLELLAIQQAFGEEDIVRVHELADRLGKQFLDIRDAKDTFLHRYWRKVAELPDAIFPGQGMGSRIELSPDGTIIAIGGNEGQLRFVDRSSMSTLSNAKVAEKSIVGICWFSDSQGCITIDDAGNVTEVRYPLASESRKIHTLAGGVRCWSLSPDSQRLGLVAKSSLNELLLIDVETDVVEHYDLPFDARDVFLGSSTDELFLLSVKGQLALFNLTDNSLNDSLDLLANRTFSTFHASPDMNYLFAIEESKDIVVVDLDAQSIRVLKSSGQYRNAIQYLDDQHFVVGSPTGLVQVFDRQRGSIEQTRLVAGYVYYFSAAANGASFITRHDGVLSTQFASIIERASHPPLMIDAVDAPGRIAFRESAERPEHFQAVVDCDGVWTVFEAGWQPATQTTSSDRELGIEFVGQVLARYQVRLVDNHVWVDDRATKESFTLDGHDASVVRAALAEDAALLMTVDESAKANLWSLKSRERILSGTLNEVPSRLEIASNGSFIAVVDGDESEATLIELDTITGEFGAELGSYELGTSFGITRDSRHIYVSENHQIKFSQVYTSEELKAEQGSEVEELILDFTPPKNSDPKWTKVVGFYPLTYALSPDGALLAIGNSTGFVEVWSVEASKRIANFQIGRDRIGDLKFSPDGKMLVATIESEGVVAIWDTY